jgi:hypothetical protein
MLLRAVQPARLHQALSAARFGSAGAAHAAMQAIVFDKHGDPDAVLSARDLDVGEPAGDEVQLRVLAVSTTAGAHPGRMLRPGPGRLRLASRERLPAVLLRLRRRPSTRRTSTPSRASTP